MADVPYYISRQKRDDDISPHAKQLRRLALRARRPMVLYAFPDGHEQPIPLEYLGTRRRYPVRNGCISAIAYPRVTPRLQGRTCYVRLLFAHNVRSGR